MQAAVHEWFFGTPGKRRKLSENSPKEEENVVDYTQLLSDEVVHNELLTPSRLDCTDVMRYCSASKKQCDWDQVLAKWFPRVRPGQGQTARKAFKQACQEGIQSEAEYNRIIEAIKKRQELFKSYHEKADGKNLRKLLRSEHPGDAITPELFRNVIQKTNLKVSNELLYWAMKQKKIELVRLFLSLPPERRELDNWSNLLYRARMTNDGDVVIALLEVSQFRAWLVENEKYPTEWVHQPGIPGAPEWFMKGTRGSMKAKYVFSDLIRSFHVYPKTENLLKAAKYMIDEKMIDSEIVRDEYRYWQEPEADRTPDILRFLGTYVE